MKCQNLIMGDDDDGAYLVASKGKSAVVPRISAAVPAIIIWGTGNFLGPSCFTAPPSFFCNDVHLKP